MGPFCCQHDHLHHCHRLCHLLHQEEEKTVRARRSPPPHPSDWHHHSCLQRTAWLAANDVPAGPPAATASLHAARTERPTRLDGVHAAAWTAAAASLHAAASTTTAADDAGASADDAVASADGAAVAAWPIGCPEPNARAAH